MSTAVDVNLLVYAADSDGPHFDLANRTLGELFNGQEIIYLFWPVVLGFIRLATHPSVFPKPMKTADAFDFIGRALRRPNVRAPGENEDFWTTLQATVAETPVAGKLVSDAHIVALMRLHGVNSIVTHDRDFRKFDGVKTIDPFA
jgi:toxin-antitoxin system PIN domain toxin